MGNRLTGLILSCAVVLVLACLMATPAGAVPNLQVYIEGATYDTDTDTWVTGDSDFYLQVIGANQPVYDVKLAAAVLPPSETLPPGSITFEPEDFTAGPQSPFTFGTPVMGNGDELPSHGIYNDGAWYTVLPIGDFGTSDWVHDMTDPGGEAKAGEIKRIHVIVTGFEAVHFDAYNHYMAGDHARYINSPFSHDGEGGGDGDDSPEPATFALFTLGLTGAFAAVRRRRAA